MPRLTNQDYLITRSELHAVWTNSPTSVYHLEATDHWALHEYIRFVENLSATASLEYRQEITDERPSLPQRGRRQMPRLTALDYLRQRAALREEWLVRDGYAFTVLSPTEQFQLHDFFEPAKDLLPLEATAHRRDITARRPSLPQQAGRAFARIRPFLERTFEPQTVPPVAERTRSWSVKDRRVHVFSQVNPELDPEAFAKIIMELAKAGPPPGWRDDAKS